MRNLGFICAFFICALLAFSTAFGGLKDSDWRSKLPRPVFDENPELVEFYRKAWEIAHTRIDNIDELEKLRGSKYVQSDLRGIFSQVRKDLMSGMPVLFSGTPCQVAALHSYLRKPYSNLTTVDFVCHGVPNPRIWKEFRKEEIKSVKINDSM